MISAASIAFFDLSAVPMVVELVMVRKLEPLLMVMFLPIIGAPFERCALDANVVAADTLSFALAEMATKLINEVFNLFWEIIKMGIHTIKMDRSAETATDGSSRLFWFVDLFWSMNDSSARVKNGSIT